MLPPPSLEEGSDSSHDSRQSSSSLAPLHKAASECSSSSDVSLDLQIKTPSAFTCCNRDLLPCLSDEVKSELRLRIRQIITFVLLSSAYAATYLLRKPFGVIKSELKSDFSLTIDILGWLEFAMFLPYAILSLCFWNLGTKLGPRQTLGFGLLVASASTALMGTVRSLSWIFVLFFITGASQALCWPASCTLLASWFSTKIRNTVVGAFGTTCFFGGASGTFLVVYLNESYGWRGVFLWPALLVAFRGVVVLVMARRPAYHGLIVPGQEDEKCQQTEEYKSFREIWRMSLVPEISLSLLCLKAVRYGIMMWLPLYLQETRHYDLKEAGLTSAAFEAGGVVGSIGMGILLDFVLNMNPLIVCSISIAGSSVALTMFIMCIDWGTVTHVAILIIAGILNCGPGLVLAGSAINKLVDPMGSNSSVLSVINGAGSIGILLEGPVIAYTIIYLGYEAVIPVLVGFSVLGTLSAYRAHHVYNRTQLYQRAALSDNL